MTIISQSFLLVKYLTSFLKFFVLKKYKIYAIITLEKKIFFVLRIIYITRTCDGDRTRDKKK